jgi:hypothetical protein
MADKKFTIPGWIYFAIGVSLFLWMLLAPPASCNGKVVVVSPIDSTIHWKNKAGDSVISQKGYEEQFAVIKKKIADSIAKVYRSRINDLQELLIISSITKAEIPAEPGTKETDYYPVVVNDDCPGQVRTLAQTFSNEHYRVFVRIGVESSYDSMHLERFDTTTVLWSWEKEGNIFNRKRFLQLDISSADPDNKINVLPYRKPQEKAKRFGIGAQLGATLTFKNFRPALKPYIGAGISYNLIRF